MNYHKILVLLSLLLACSPTNIHANNYENYHNQIIEAEKRISSGNFNDALLIYESVIDDYDFIFLREYQVATQLALHLNNEQKAIHYLKRGILAGWEMKSIKRNKYLVKLHDDKEWKSIKKEYNTLRSQYEANLNQQVRTQVKKMFIKDQWKALGALLTFSSKGQDRYAERKFAPHSEKQIQHIIKIIDDNGYPGERLIGNNFWIATILSHHNSISAEYVQKDTLYPFLKPELLEAIKMGQMSPWEFAAIDNWYRVVKSNREKSGYGYLNSPSKTDLTKVNELRQKIGLRTIETRNKLIDIERSTGMNFYLPGNPWVRGKINIKE